MLFLDWGGRGDDQPLTEGEVMAVLTWALQSQMGKAVTAAAPAWRQTGFQGSGVRWTLNPSRVAAVLDQIQAGRVGWRVQLWFSRGHRATENTGSQKPTLAIEQSHKETYPLFTSLCFHIIFPNIMRLINIYIRWKNDTANTFTT